MPAPPPMINLWVNFHLSYQQFEDFLLIGSWGGGLLYAFVFTMDPISLIHFPPYNPQLCHPLVMGPPPKTDVRRWRAFLDKQNSRKRAATALRQREAKGQLVKRAVSAALRAQAKVHQEQADRLAEEVRMLTRRSNRHFLEAGTLRCTAKEAAFWKAEATRLMKENQSLHAKVVASTRREEALKEKERRAEKALDELTEWRCWYLQLKRRAGKELTRLLNKWGYSKPPVARDRGWGGGQ